MFDEQNPVHEKLQGYIVIFWAKGLVDKAASDLVEGKEDTIRHYQGSQIRSNTCARKSVMKALGFAGNDRIAKTLGRGRYPSSL